jgi:hypothetical protein
MMLWISIRGTHDLFLHELKDKNQRKAGVKRSVGLGKACTWIGFETCRLGEYHVREIGVIMLPVVDYKL